MTTATSDYKHWPYPISEEDRNDAETVEKIAFLQAAFEAGSDAYSFGVNNYGAKSEHRSGVILERGRRRWEIRLSENDLRRMSAFVRCFCSAGLAVSSWLDGKELTQVLKEIDSDLVVPPGLDKSHKIY